MFGFFSLYQIADINLHARAIKIFPNNHNIMYKLQFKAVNNNNNIPHKFGIKFNSNKV